jgi:hypothetical protein
MIVAVAAGREHTCALRADGQVFCWGGGSNGTTGDGSQFGPLFATPVPSFRFNIDPHVVLKHHHRGRAAQVTVLANCPAGEKVHIEVRVTQGAISGHGQTVERCKDGLHGFPVTVHARGPKGFQAGPAQAEADAIVRDHRDLVETQHWTRKVDFALEP